mmetsp:Transcript_22210/g.53285  ORF Transcript_22210/g.53285 Transcript_22210/m.53285 type:complete len:279 (+) Transcript_22210:906-1742(+)
MRPLGRRPSCSSGWPIPVTSRMRSTVVFSYEANAEFQNRISRFSFSVSSCLAVSLPPPARVTLARQASIWSGVRMRAFSRRSCSSTSSACSARSRTARTGMTNCRSESTPSVDSAPASSISAATVGTETGARVMSANPAASSGPSTTSLPSGLTWRQSSLSCAPRTWSEERPAPAMKGSLPHGRESHVGTHFSATRSSSPRILMSGRRSHDSSESCSGGRFSLLLVVRAWRSTTARSAEALAASKANRASPASLHASFTCSALEAEGPASPLITIPPE